MKFLLNVLKTLSTLDLYAGKKRQIPNDISKYFIYWSISELFYSSPRKKQNWNNRRIGQMNSNFFNKEFVSSFFPVNWRGVNFLWQPNIDISETFKEFTLPVILSSPLATAQQTLLILCGVGVLVVLRLHSDTIEEIECTKSPQFNLTLELIESRWRTCLIHLQLTVEPNVIFLAMDRDGNSSNF